MKKKSIFVIFIIAMLCIIFVGCSAGKGTNFVVNGGFEDVSVSGDEKIITGWTKSIKGSFSFKQNIYDDSDNFNPQLGERYAYVAGSTSSNEFENLYTPLKLSSGSTYKLSAMINVESVTPANKVGIKVGFKEDTMFDGINLVEKTNGWEYKEIYFVANTSKEVNLYIGIGNSENKVSGTAGFDNVNLEKVSSVPDGVVAGQIQKLNYGNDYSLADGGSISFVVLLALLTLILIVLAYFVIRKIMSFGKLPVVAADNVGKLTFKSAMTSPIANFSYLIIGAFLVRFLIVIFSYGMGTNVTSLADIGKLVSENSFLSIYINSKTVIEPMGVTYVMGIFGMLANVTGIDYGSLGGSILMRLPSVVAEIVTVYYIYSYATKYQGEKMALVYSGFYALLPIFFILGSMYASVQSIAISLLVAMFVCMLDKKYVASGILFTIALMFSNFALLALPALLIFQIMAVVKEKDQRLNILASMLVCLLAFLALSMPLCWSQFKKGNIFYYFKVMFDYFGSFNLLSSDAFGLFAMFGVANSKEKILIFDILNWILVLIFASLIIYHYIKHENRLDLIFMTSLTFMTYALLGSGVPMQVLPIGIALLLLYLVNMPDKRLFWIFGGMSCLSFINMGAIIAKCGYIVGGTSAKYLPFAAKSGVLITFSIFAVGLLFYALYIAADILFFSTSRTIQPLERTLKNELKFIFSFVWFKKWIENIKKNKADNHNEKIDLE